MLAGRIGIKKGKTERKESVITLQKLFGEFATSAYVQ